MNKIIIGIVIAIVVVSGIVTGFLLTNNKTDNTQIANPASVNCERLGGRVTIITAEDGGQIGMCTALNGSQCEEWALMRGECTLRQDTIPSNELSACTIDTDCIPLPSECHPHTCINKIYEKQFVKPEVCTMMFDTTAAYSPNNCACVLNACVNKNLNTTN